jgi:glycosyltransferase involved in cell wall biosynthesis
MRVLHLIKTGVGASWACRQIGVLGASGIEVVVALPGGERAPMAARYREAGATVREADLDFSARTPWRLARALGRCRRLVDDVRPDLIHSHFVSTTLVTRLALGRRHPTPRIFQVPGPLHLEHAAYGRLDVATGGPNDHWIGSCRWTCAEYVRRGVPPERVSLSYYGGDVASLAGGRRGALRRELHLTDDVPLVGMVAWMYGPKWFLGQRRGIKGHEDFIDAFGLVRRRCAGARAVVVGGPWAGARAYERRLRERAGGTVAFTGARTDIPDVYADLDLAVHPSLSENCGGAAESLAAGCPTIATSVGGLPDLVIPGRTGWLVPPRDPDRLADAIVDGLEDREEGRRRACAGQALVRRLFDVRRTGAEIAGIYGRVLGESVTETRACTAG